MIKSFITRYQYKTNLSGMSVKNIHTATVRAIMTLIGREREKSILKSCFESDKSEFVAIYGRRRVGKTFLIKEFFEGNFAFYSTGILNGNKDVQLQAWNNEISRFGGADIPAAGNWFEAFENLNEAIEGYIETKLAHGIHVPEPFNADKFSGKFVLRIPKTLHYKLSVEAEKEGVSLNQYALYKLSKG